MSVSSKDVISGNWKELKGKIKQQWGIFTEDEVLQMNGTYDELEGALQKKYGHTKEDAESEISEFIKKHLNETAEKVEE